MKWKDEEGNNRLLLSHITSVFELRTRKNMKTRQKGYLDSGPKIWIQNLPTRKKLWYSFDRNIRSKYVTFKVGTINLLWSGVAKNALRDAQIYS